MLLPSLPSHASLCCSTQGFLSSLLLLCTRNDTYLVITWLCGVSYQMKHVFPAFCGFSRFSCAVRVRVGYDGDPPPLPLPQSRVILGMSSGSYFNRRDTALGCMLRCSCFIAHDVLSVWWLLHGRAICWHTTPSRKHFIVIRVL